MAAYLIVDSDIKDSEMMQSYLDKVGDTVAPFNGRLLASSTNIEVMEGDWRPKRFVIAEFPSMDTAKEWYNSPAYQEILPLRLNATDDKLIMVEGV